MKRKTKKTTLTLDLPYFDIFPRELDNDNQNHNRNNTRSSQQNYHIQHPPHKRRKTIKSSLSLDIPRVAHQQTLDDSGLPEMIWVYQEPHIDPELQCDRSREEVNNICLHE